MPEFPGIVGVGWRDGEVVIPTLLQHADRTMHEEGSTVSGDKPPFFWLG